MFERVKDRRSKKKKKIKLSVTHFIVNDVIVITIKYDCLYYNNNTRSYCIL